ncbi:hypothetical protein FE782_14670 [Paenibacillus antri]|uniref:Uncharacterized protein n=1 Tax=Paenibacillus antri TaxID=2582848 RepID=A0A5R9G4S0_9BACL|nr:hypothetical protein [Paenibacillus antri]TLS51357.1 hypothetical protein FE782_14670 [Paenibacillus antri]
MLYLVNLAAISLWMAILLRKRTLSLHSVVTAYVIGVGVADFFEGLFNVVLGLYQFPTHLRTDPAFDNELGVVFSDFLILPFVFIIFVHYAARTAHPWRVSIAFAALHVSLEWIYVKLGYLTYVHWSVLYSACFYVGGFRFGAYLAPRISSYRPPIPYRLRLLCFSHMILMWVSAVFALPLLKLYQFKPGLFHNIITDCRVAELVTGDILSVLCALFIPMTPHRLKPAVFAAIAGIGAFIAVFAYSQGWLIYYHWNLFLSVLRYVVPVGLIMLYDRWESAYQVALNGGKCK